MATGSINVTTILNSEAYTASLAAFEKAVEAIDCSLEIKTAFLNCALHLINEGRSVRLDVDPAPSTREVRVFLKPSKAFLGLMAAAGAGDGNDILIGGGHG